MAGKQEQVTALRHALEAKETETLALKRALAVKTVVKSGRDEQSAPDLCRTGVGRNRRASASAHASLGD